MGQRGDGVSSHITDWTKTEGLCADINAWNKGARDSIFFCPWHFDIRFLAALCARGIRGLKRKIGQESSGFQNHTDLKAYFLKKCDLDWFQHLHIAALYFTMMKDTRFHGDDEGWKWRKAMVFFRKYQSIIKNLEQPIAKPLVRIQQRTQGGL